MGTHGPVDEEYKDMMEHLMMCIDKLVNGDAEDKKVGFVLLMFPFGEAPPDRNTINYMSNAYRPDMIIALKELIARFEGRHVEETQTAIPGEQ